VRRRIVREKVVQALYAHEIAGDPPEHVINCVLAGLSENKMAHQFARNLVIETINHTVEIDRIIRGRVTNWDFKRIAVLDRLILRMAICELLFFREIPPKVSMNEAIELAKLFSTQRSGQFVNGVLDSVMSDFKRGRLPGMGAGIAVKSGRGLHEGHGHARPHKDRTK
jgi:N utilization substance protein B